MLCFVLSFPYIICLVLGIIVLASLLSEVVEMQVLIVRWVPKGAGFLTINQDEL